MILNIDKYYVNPNHYVAFDNQLNKRLIDPFFYHGLEIEDPYLLEGAKLEIDDDCVVASEGVLLPSIGQLRILSFASTRQIL